MSELRWQQARLEGQTGRILAEGRCCSQSEIRGLDWIGTPVSPISTSSLLTPERVAIGQSRTGCTM